MTSKPNDAQEVLRKIAEAMAQDLMDTPLKEALKELRETDGPTATRGDELRSEVAAVMNRLKKGRLVAARRAYEQEMSRARSKVVSLVGESRDALLAKVQEILARQPALRLAFRERDGSQMTERELATIVEDLCDLEEHSRDKAEN